MRNTGLRRLCVFCGANPGNKPAYLQQARELGTHMAELGLELVYGGGNVGLMGQVADAVLKSGGKAYGVIPQALVDRELAHQGLTRLEIVANMHERKARMASLADAFIALPGGYGTLEEFFEAITWSQLGLHGKPLGMLNTGGYYDGLIRFVERAIDEEFIRAPQVVLFVVRDEPKRLLDALLESPSHGTARVVTEGDI